jgi:hypothetical protein
MRSGEVRAWVQRFHEMVYDVPPVRERLIELDLQEQYRMVTFFEEPRCLRLVS